MEYRHLGNSGLIISEIAYGNWITHGSQGAEQAAAECVRAALEAGITTFDTAYAYAGGRAEEVLGRALRGVRRESLEIFTKVYWPTGDKPNDRGLSRKHITESLHASLRRLQIDYVDLYQAHRYDYETPIDETMRAFDDLVRAGKVLYIGVSEWRAEEIATALRAAGELGLDRIVSNQPQPLNLGYPGFFSPALMRRKNAANALSSLRNVCCWEPADQRPCPPGSASRISGSWID